MAANIKARYRVTNIGWQTGAAVPNPAGGMPTVGPAAVVITALRLKADGTTIADSGITTTGMTGTTFTFDTDAAGFFEVGQDYDFTVTPVPVPAA